MGLKTGRSFCLALMIQIGLEPNKIVILDQGTPRGSFVVNYILTRIIWKYNQNKCIFVETKKQKVMKKIILIISILFVGFNGYSQTEKVLRNDTTFFEGRRKDNGHRNGIWYERITIVKQVDDSASWVKFDSEIKDIKRKRKIYRRNTHLAIGLFTLFNVIMLIKFN